VPSSLTAMMLLSLRTAFLLLALDVSAIFAHTHY
jgi:hypothetical protein